MILSFKRQLVMDFEPNLILQVLDCAFYRMDFLIIIAFEITIA